MSIDTTVSHLVEREFFVREVFRQAATAPRSECCNAPIQGTAQHWCGNCQTSIELDRETHAPPVRSGGTR